MRQRRDGLPLKRRTAAAAAAASFVFAGTGCGIESEALDGTSAGPAASASPVSAKSADCPSDAAAGFSLRVVYNVTNTHEEDSLKAAGAPAHARGITRSELLIRDDITLIRRSGTSWVKDPDKYWAWQDEGEFLTDTELSSQEVFERGMAWKEAGNEIPMVTVPIEWVDLRAPAPRYSYRYGLDAMAPDFGERWREKRHRFDSDDINAALFDGQFPALMEGIGEDIDVSRATFAGHECEMLRKRNGKVVNETCYVTLGGHTVVLHGMDSSPKGVHSQTAVSVEQGLCITDQMLAAPGRVRFEDVRG